MITEREVQAAENRLDRLLAVRADEEEIGRAWEAYSHLFAAMLRQRGQHVRRFQTVEV